MIVKCNFLMFCFVVINPFSSDIHQGTKNEGIPVLEIM